MKKIFTLIAAAFVAVAASAQTTLISYEHTSTLPTGVTIGGTCTLTTGKYQLNKTSVNVIKLSNGYTTENVLNDNVITLTTTDSFKKGDVVTVSGFINNSDESKAGSFAILVNADTDAKYTDLFKGENVINGRLVSDDPTVLSYTLTDDYQTLLIGRTGGTAVNIYTISVVRPAATAVESVSAAEQATAQPKKVVKNGKIVIETAAGTFNVAGQQVK